MKRLGINIQAMIDEATGKAEMDRIDKITREWEKNPLENLFSPRDWEDEEERDDE